MSRSKITAIDDLEARKRKLGDVLTTFKTKIDESKEVADEKKTEIQSRFEQLQVQLALGKSETRDALEEQKKKLAAKIEAFRNDLSVKKGIAEKKAAAFESQFKKGFDQIKHAFKDMIS